MALPPVDFKSFMFSDGLIDQQVHNAVDARARTATPVTPPTLGEETDEKGPTFAELVEEVRRLKTRDAQHEQKIIGLKNLWPRFIKDNWNKSCAAVESEVGLNALSDYRTNLCSGGGFRDWAAGVPYGWSATGTATLTKGTTRTGGIAANSSCQIQTAGASGGITKTISIQPGRTDHLGIWLYLQSGSLVLACSSDGTDPFSFSKTFAATEFGAAAWFPLPSPKVQGMPLAFAFPTDATTLTLTITGAVNSAVAVADVQVGPGPIAWPDLWQPAMEDILPDVVEQFGGDVYSSRDNSPGGLAGGDLTGTYPHPQLSASGIIGTQIFGG